MRILLQISFAPTLSIVSFFRSFFISIASYFYFFHLKSFLDSSVPFSYHLGILPLIDRHLDEIYWIGASCSFLLIALNQQLQPGFGPQSLHQNSSYQISNGLYISKTNGQFLVLIHLFNQQHLAELSTSSSMTHFQHLVPRTLYSRFYHFARFSFSISLAVYSLSP